jgi:hypothetical protein
MGLEGPCLAVTDGFFVHHVFMNLDLKFSECTLYNVYAKVGEADGGAGGRGMV